MSAACAHAFNQAIWIEVAVIAGFLLAGMVRWWQKDNHWFWSFYRLPALIVSCVIIMILFSARPVDLKQPPARMTAAASDGLVQIELKKANDEIQYRIQQEDTWFHYKFIFVGGLFAAFFATFQITHRSRTSLIPIVGSMRTCFVLALACIVALAVDIHLRNNIVVIQQLALWIRYYAEPSLLNTAGPAFQPWEAFLRTPAQGMHTDEMYGFLFYPHLHFLTWLLYMLYLNSFQWLAIKAAPASSRADDGLLAGGFVFVHLALAAFAFVGHFVPGTLTMKAIPGVDCSLSGLDAAVWYLIATLALVAVNSPYLARFLFPNRFRSPK